MWNADVWEPQAQLGDGPSLGTIHKPCGLEAAVRRSRKGVCNDEAIV
jgi:hypothetical protein